MLCLSLQPGEYLTIGDDVVLQYTRTSGESCKLIIDAPREIPVLRGAVRERNGGERPAWVTEKPSAGHREVPWNQSKTEALSAMRRLLYQMDGHNPDVRDLRRQLNHMFPPDPAESPFSPGAEARLK